MPRLSATKHAIMQVSPNKRRHHHSNAEPQGQLLRQTLDADRHVGASLRDEHRVRLLCVQVDERGVAAHVGTRDRQPGGGEGVGNDIARKIVAGDDERLPAVE